MAFDPYLFFGGNCRTAFTRYHEIFGGNLDLMTVGDSPEGPDGAEVPEDQRDLVLHASLDFGDHYLMGSDDPTADPFGPVQGMMISYTASDEADARRVFDALAEGGEVVQDLTPTFFSPAFGMCTDRFGTPWMVSTVMAP